MHHTLLTVDPTLTPNQQFAWFYHNDPKFSDRSAWANSADLDQTLNFLGQLICSKTVLFQF